MKKLLRKRSMLLVAFLVSLCMPVMAQTAASSVDDLLKISGLVPSADGQTLYYLKNVGTGLNVTYGGRWGTSCVESQSAHPIVLEDNGNGTVSIASIVGYFESKGLWFDFPKMCPDKTNLSTNDQNKYADYTAGELTSQWTLVPVEGYTNQYHLVSNDGRYLSSIGNKSGLLVLKADEGKAFQRWVFTSGEHIKNNFLTKASSELPFDVSVAIRGGSFDLVDDFEEQPQTPEIFKDKGMLPYLGEYWANYLTYDTWVWNRGVRDWNADVYNYCNILQNLGKDTYVSYNMTLPAGAYRFTFEGFYRHRYSNCSFNAYVILYDVNNSEELGRKQLAQNNSVGYTTDNPNTSERNDGDFGVNDQAATIFRDNDTYLNEMTFYLTKETTVQIRVDREGIYGGYDNEQNIYLDNFNLYYSGYYSIDGVPVVKESMAWIDEYEYGVFSWNADYLYLWDTESQSYKVYVHPREGEVYPGPYNYQSYLDLANDEGLPIVAESDITIVTRDELETLFSNANNEFKNYSDLMDGKVPQINALLQAADDNIIYKNQLNANINDYRTKLNETGLSVFNEKLVEYGVNPNNINSRSEYFQAIAGMELAFADALVAQARADVLDKIKDGETDFTGVIYNHSFELGVDDNGEPKGWDVFAGTADWGPRENSQDTYKTQGTDGRYLYNIWSWGNPLVQEISNMPEGTYILSALIASNDNGNRATVYLLGNGEQRRGVNPPNSVKGNNGGNEAGLFGDFSLKCIVGSDKKLRVGVVGGNDDDTPEKPIGSYNPNGHWWYKCDNFRLEYLPNGRLPLRDEDTKIKNLIDPFVGVDVTRSINSGNWSTLVLPFDMPCPDNWDVETLNVVDQYDGDIRLTFTAIDKSQGLKAGVPYIVRVETALDKISVNDVNVNTTLLIPATKSSAEYDVEFVPVYTNGFIPASELQKDENGVLVKENDKYIPTGTQYYFLSGGKLKRCVYENYNKIKGFRAYFKVTPKTAEARNALRSLSMRTSEETDIENVATEEVKVIGIYDVNGIRLSEMKPGINILRMNNGTTKKVMVK